MKKNVVHTVVKSLIFLITFLIHSIGFSQESLTWFEPDASWIYNYQTIAGPEQFQAAFEITETEFAGQQCVKMEVVGDYPFLCTPFDSPIYFYESNDSVFFAMEVDDNFRLAYDFNSEVGSEWEYALPVSESVINYFNVEVIAVNTVMVDGHEVKEMVLEYHSATPEPLVEIFPEEITVREFLGGINSFFIPLGHQIMCDAETSIALQCLNSISVNYINPDFGTCTVSASKVNSPESIKVYPNPANDYIYIDASFNAGAKMQILQLDGKLIFSHVIVSETERIDLPKLNAGMYIVEVSDEDNRYFGKVFIGN